MSGQVPVTDAFHEHSRAMAIATVPVPPPAYEDAVLVTVAWQRLSVGLVRFVRVELPHDAAATAATSSGTREPAVSRTGAMHNGRQLVQFQVFPLRASARFPEADVVFRIRRILFLLCTVALLTGCAGGYTLARLDGVDAALSVPIAWYSPAVPDDRVTLARWRASVGPPLVRHAPAAVESRSDAITIVSWNTALGAGDVLGFVRALRAEAPGRPIVLLLQEVYRRGDAVPRALARHAAFAGRLGGAAATSATAAIDSVAAELGMSAYYVPSMRNGGGESDEDRGNAILANVPIANLEAIELPFERQRRVAVAATVEGVTVDGRPWRVRVVSAHLDNTIARRGWIGSEYGRARQARGLVALLKGGVPTVLGGDFNTWFGFSDQAYVETARAFPQTPTADRRATFLGLLRLDHLFFRLPAGWSAKADRSESRYGSDHAPLIGSVRFN